MSAKIAIHTEADARALWCPFAGNRPESGLDGERCLASKCMSWRWAYTHLPDENGDLVGDGNTMGFCGLAGAPYPRGGA